METIAPPRSLDVCRGVEVHASRATSFATPSVASYGVAQLKSKHGFFGVAELFTIISAVHYAPNKR